MQGTALISGNFSTELEKTPEPVDGGERRIQRSGFVGINSKVPYRAPFSAPIGNVVENRGVSWKFLLGVPKAAMLYCCDGNWPTCLLAGST